MGDIGWAVEQMRLDKCVQRAGWNGKNMYIFLYPPANSNHNPYVGMYTAEGTYQAGWLCSQADLLADDWELYTEEVV